MRRSEYGPVVDGLDRLGAEEVFGDEAARRQYLTETSVNEGVNGYIWLNGKCRDIPCAQQGLSTSDYMFVGETLANAHETSNFKVSYISPPVAQRQRLLIETFDTVRRVGEEDMERAATLLRVAAYAIHACVDGNTRTTAHVYSLLTRGYEGTDKDREYYASILGGEADREWHNLNTQLDPVSAKFTQWALDRELVYRQYKGPIPSYTLPFGMDEIHSVATGCVGEASLKWFGFYAAEDYFSTYTLAILALRKGFSLEQFLAEDEEGQIAIDPVEVSRSLFGSDLSLLAGIHDQTKQEFVRSLNHSFLRNDPQIYGLIDGVVEHYRAR